MPIKDIIGIIRALIELWKLIGAHRTHLALRDKARDCRIVAAEMVHHPYSPEFCRQYEEEKNRD